MKKISVLFVGIFLSFHSFSQDKLIVLHQAVGDTIDKAEKVRYLLFPELKDSDFYSCFLTQSGDEFLVSFHSSKDSVAIFRIDSAEVSRYRENIGKLLEYYSNRTKEDSIKRSQKITLEMEGPNTFQLNDPVVGSDDKDRILEEVRKFTRLKGDAERQKIVQDGNDIFGNSARIEFLNFKCKKKN
ncbi:MAG: hypothetical protein WAO52_16875 [Prolixibacteraceae bacterium]